jgi:hypothetical protein
MTRAEVFLRDDVLARLRSLALAAMPAARDPWRDGFLFALGCVAESFGLRAEDVTQEPAVRISVPAQDLLDA